MKKTLAILLSLALVICMIPATASVAFAADSYTVKVTGTYTYNGKAQTPKITVKDGETVVDSSKYTVSYSKGDTSVPNPTDAGNYTVTVTEKEPVSGLTKKSGTGAFTIKSLDISTNTSVQITSAGNIADTYKENEPVPMDQSGLTFYFGGYTNATIFNDQSLKITVASADGKNATLNVAGEGNLTGTRNGIVVKQVTGLNASNTTVTAWTRPYYNGVAQNVKLSVVYNKDDKSKITLTQGTDFVVTPVTATNVSETTFTIRGIGKYAGSFKDNVAYIQPKAVGTAAGTNNVKVSPISTQVVNASPKITVTDVIDGKEKELTLGQDYLCLIKTDTIGKNAGNAVITFQGNYSGSRTLTFDVVDSNADLANAEVFVDTAWTNTYSGKAQYPNNISVYMTVSGARKLLTQNVDYTVEYQYSKDNKTYSVTNPTDANIYTVVVKGKGVYGGEKAAATSFMIRQYDMKNVTVTATVTSAYTAPAVTVRGANGVTFEKDKDYTVYYSANSNRSTMYVSVSPTGNGNLTGSSFSKTYSISARSMSYCTVAFRDGRSSAVYTGYAIPIDVYVLDGTTTLTKGVHYNVVYRNSAGKVVSTIRDAGTYTIEVVGDGGYTGTKTLTFTVTGNDISSYTVTLDKSSANATGYAITLPRVLSVARGSAKLTTSDYTVSYKDSDDKTVSRIVNPGTYKVVVTGAGKYSGSTYAVFTVAGKSQSITGVKSTYKAYPGGEVIQLYPKATEGRFTYTSSDSTVATVSASGLVTPLKAGRAKITIKTTGTTTYDPATYSTVIKVYPKKAVMTKKPWNYGKKGQVKVRWYKQDNVTRYEIRYSRAKNFAKGTYITKKVNAAQNDYTTQSTTIKNLKSGQKYYVKVRAVKEVYNDYGKKLTYYGAWSGWRSVVVK